MAWSRRAVRQQRLTFIFTVLYRRDAVVYPAVAIVNTGRSRGIRYRYAAHNPRHFRKRPGS